MHAQKELHPIVLQMEPSDEQRAAIAERGRDVAVTAGAGAGKTRALVARYLALLAEGLPLRSIVAITFTKKAAREMRNRARREIRRYLESRTGALAKPLPRIGRSAHQHDPHALYRDPAQPSSRG